MRRNSQYRFTAVLLAGLLFFRCFAAYATETWDFGASDSLVTEDAAHASDFADILTQLPSDSLPFTLPDAPPEEITYASDGQNYTDETSDPYYYENADVYAAISSFDAADDPVYFSENEDIYAAVDFASEDSDGYEYYTGSGEDGSTQYDYSSGMQNSSADEAGGGMYDLVTASAGVSYDAGALSEMTGAPETETGAGSDGAWEDVSDTQDIKFTNQVSGVYVNPLYEYLDIDVDSSASEPADLSLIKAAADTPKFSDTASAAAYFREAMVSRRTVVEFMYTDIFTDPDSLESDITSRVSSILEQVFSHTGNPVEGDYLQFQFQSISYNLSYTMDDLTYTALCTFNVLYYSDAKQEAEVTKRVSSVLRSLELDGKSDYGKIRAIYDYICGAVRYDYAHCHDSSYKLQFTAYAALVNGTAVCQGYAVLLYRMLLEAGIDCRCIEGYAVSGGQTEGHTWNIIKLGSLYYLADSTWDSPDRTDDPVTHDYFLCGNTEKLFPNHSASEKYTTPEFLMSYPMSLENYKSSSPDPYDSPILKCGVSSAALDKTKTKKIYVTVRSGDFSGVSSNAPSIASVAAYPDQGKTDPDSMTLKFPIVVTAGKTAGKARITIKTVSGLSKSITVTVNKASTKSISTPKKTYRVKKGKTVKLNAAVIPSYSDDSITYTSANRKIATVSKSGKVTGIKKGTTTITIKSGKVKKKVTIKVT